MKILPLIIGLMPLLVSAQQVDIKNTRINGTYKLPNTVAPLDYEDDLMFKTNAGDYIPVPDKAFYEHVRSNLNKQESEKLEEIFKSNNKSISESDFSTKINTPIMSIQTSNDTTWIGTKQGLYLYRISTKELTRHDSYGINGPLSTIISDIALDSKGKIWIGSPIGLSIRDKYGNWSSIRGTGGLPVEDITTLEIDQNDRIWIGTTQGAILYTPYEQGRKWFYRAGKRYLINNSIEDISIAEDGNSIYFKTSSGLSKISIIERTLGKKADIIESKVDQWHRRLGLVASCELDDAENPTSHTIKYSENDGLWTAYHVVAMSLAYASSKDISYLNSAKKGMDALIMLQNASGIPGVVARSVLPIEMKDQMNDKWRVTPDGTSIWKCDTSSDEIDGHFFAFYAYWEHIAKHNPDEAAQIKKQVSTLINSIVDNNYQLIDWNGERTKWGFWNPEALNENPDNYLENGLNSAQILSFLKVSYYITGDNTFKKHYDKLITEHGYLGNVLLEKKVFPDKNNHSDNQLGYCALYPLLQLEYDPKAREALQMAVRRHHRTLSRDGSSFFYFAAATIDPDFVEIKDAVEFLRQVPTDRRQWKMINSNRKDIIWHPYKDRFDKEQLLYVLPADERNFSRWNRNPYYPDSGKGGKYVDGAASWLLAYWMGRYHGFINDEE